jgi:hypothetical protein
MSVIVEFGTGSRDRVDERVPCAGRRCGVLFSLADHILGVVLVLRNDGSAPGIHARFA